MASHTWGCCEASVTGRTGAGHRAQCSETTRCPGERASDSPPSGTGFPVAGFRVLGSRKHGLCDVLHSQRGCPLPRPLLTLGTSLRLPLRVSEHRPLSGSSCQCGCSVSRFAGGTSWLTGSEAPDEVPSSLQVHNHLQGHVTRGPWPLHESRF